MTTIDTHARRIDTRPEAAAAGDAHSVGTCLVGVGDWLTTTDHKRIGRLFTRCRLRRPARRGRGGRAARHRTHRSPRRRCSTSTSIPQLFALVPGRPHRSSSWSRSLLGIAHRRRAAAARRPLADLPAAGGVGLLDVVRRRGPRRHPDRPQRRPGRRQQHVVELFLVGHIMLLLGLVAARRLARHDRAHRPGHRA